MSASPVPREPDRLEASLTRLYGERGLEVLPRLRAALARWQRPVRAALGERRRGFTEKDVVLIAYADHLRRAGEAPLATLSRFCREHLTGLVSTVHVLPFHPSTSYDGYAITDYRAVDPALGGWEHLEEMSGELDLMMDLVLNHCSASHPWVEQYRADREPGRRYVLTAPDPAAPWLDSVQRARNVPLLHPIHTASGPRHVWTTYSPDLIDLDWKAPGLCVEFLEILLDAIVRGARVIRLDAFAYTWKEPGTRCIGLPGTHHLLRLFQELLDEAGAGSVALLPSITNLTQAENYAYLETADLVYHLPLPGLLLSTLYSADARVLRRWLKALPAAPRARAYLNLSATHDGIGLTWLADVLPEEDRSRLLAEAAARGALLSSRRTTAQGEDVPWEINATWFSACAGDSHASRLFATQSVVLALRGVPAIYLPVLLAGANDHQRVEETGDHRAINRGRFDVAAWEGAVAEPRSIERAIFSGMTRLLRARRSSPAFHPEGVQRILDTGEASVLAVERTPPGDEPGGASSVLCLTSFSARPVRLARAARWHDLVSGESGSDTLELAPFQARWLTDAGRA